jgi:hypothetical protein
MTEIEDFLHKNIFRIIIPQNPRFVNERRKGEAFSSFLLFFFSLQMTFSLTLMREKRFINHLRVRAPLPRKSAALSAFLSQT